MINNAIFDKRGEDLKCGNLFDSIPENFFKILTGNNKRFYSDCLLELHEMSIFTDAADFDREVVNRVITTCLEDYCGTLEAEDSDDDDMNALSEQEKLSASCLPTKESAFRKLLTHGWVEADFDGNHRQLVSFTVPALTIIPQLKRMAQPSRISLGGYTRNIIENLQAVMTAKHPYQDAFLLAVNNTYQFMQEMAKIRVAIRDEIECIFRCNSFQGMTTMLNAYLDSYLNGDYYKLQFEENLTASERQKITSLLMDIENNDEVFQKLIDGAKDYLSIDSEEDANLHILKAIETIRIRLCEEYERQYREIQKNQARYITSANSKMSMLIADKKDSDSTINRIVRAISECTEEELYNWNTQLTWLKMLQSLLNMPQVNHFSEASLYKPRTPPRARNLDIAILPQREKGVLDISDLKDCLPRYSVATVNKKLDDYLAGKEQLSSEELPLSTRDDFNDLVSIVLFSDDPDCNYIVKPGNDRIEKNGYTASSFVVKRK